MSLVLLSLAGQVGHEHLCGLVGDHEIHAGPLRDGLRCHPHAQKTGISFA